MALRDRLLGTTQGYGTFRRLIRADDAMSTIVRDYVRPRSPESVLDIGCGPGDLARMLPVGVGYLGIDSNPAYLGSADGLAAPAGARFMNVDLAQIHDCDLGHFDVAVAIGVLHHLDDSVVENVVATVYHQLPPGGRLITVDPAFHPTQRSITRVMLALDRGRFVRHPSDYERLLAPTFGRLLVEVRHDLLPIPYTHCILVATKADLDATDAEFVGEYRTTR